MSSKTTTKHRTRRTDPNKFGTIHWDCPTCPTLIIAPAVRYNPYETEREWITYSTSEDRARYNACTHFRYVTVSGGGALTQSCASQGESSSNDDVGGSIARLISLPYPTPTPFEELFEQMYEEQDFTKYYGEALRRLRNATDIKRQVSILNFIHELKQFKKLFRFWTARASFLRNIASGHLNIKYGWKPFIGDVVELLKGLTVYRSRLKKLLAEEGTIRVLHVSFDVPLPPMRRLYRTNQHCYSNCINPDLIGYEAVAVFGPWVKLRGTIKYSYYVPGLSEHQAEVRAFCDAFGVAWDPQIIWDAIPFSFIADWFFRVGDWLHDNFYHDPFPVDLRIHETCWSLKAAGQVTYVSTWQNGDCATPIDTSLETEKSVARQSGIVYKRWLRVPTPEDLVYSGWDSLSLKHVLTGAALLVTNSKRK